MPRPDYTLPLDQLPDPLPIEPLRKPFDVTITPPGSKSITCRAYVLAALAQGESKLIRPLRADDTDLLLKALCTLGAEARWAPNGEDVFIKGVGGRFPRGGSVNLGDGGTPTRFMIACACLAAEPVIVDGSKRMRERPIAEGVDMLRQLGAKIEYVEEEGRLPVRVTPSEKFVGGEIEVGQTQSSQFISALMLIAPWVKHGVDIRLTAPPTSSPYIDLTGHMMWEWGCGFDLAEAWEDASPSDPKCMAIEAVSMNGRTLEIEPDVSSVLYWFAAAMLQPKAAVTVPFVVSRSSQPDARSLLSLATAGCELIVDLEGPTTVCGIDTLEGLPHENCADFPDAAMTLAILAAHSSRQSRLVGLRTLRVKETDRIAALANELRRVGCKVATGEDWIEITPPNGRDARSTGSTGVSPLNGGTGVPPVTVSRVPNQSSVGEVLERRRRNLPHWELGGSTYFITFRVREGEFSHEERRIIAHACRYWHGKRITLHMGVVMHDHVHMLLTPLRCGEDATGQPRYHALSDLLHSIKSFTAHEIQRLRGASGPFWQEESYDRIMRDDDEYLEKWNYMLNNPAQAGLVKRGEVYEHFVMGNHDTGGTPVPPSQITGETPVLPVVIETYNDHRMAMAFAVLGLNPPHGVPLAICNPKCVAKSYPTFWKDFAKLYQ